MNTQLTATIKQYEVITRDVLGPMYFLRRCDVEGLLKDELYIDGMGNEYCTRDRNEAQLVADMLNRH